MSLGKFDQTIRLPLPHITRLKPDLAVEVSRRNYIVISDIDLPTNIQKPSGPKESVADGACTGKVCTTKVYRVFQRGGGYAQLREFDD
jgi:hypothetical protein